ncbi:monocarboxylate transporter [Xylogone sp. PMI_703]|nr:monocarboxylate transporter [Xylogone sp. PMI_703]
MANNSEEVTAEIVRLIQASTENITNRAKRVAAIELCRFSPEEVSLILAQLHPEINRPGNNDACGPVFNGAPAPPWLHAVVDGMLATGTVMLIPLQLGAAVGYMAKGRFKDILTEVPKPTANLWSWGRGLMAHVKASPQLVQESLEPGVALCVNRAGNFKLLRSGYSIASHIWGESMGWQTPTSWGPVSLALRKKGMHLEHLKKFFDHCEAEWLWLDVLAMPEVYEDMSDSEKESTERVRIKIINNLRGIYQRADNVIVFDSLLLRLHTMSIIDVAVILSLSRWVARIWCLTESRLARSVVIKTSDGAFDLDEILNFLRENVNNESHHYYPLFYRLSNLRPPSPSNVGLIRSRLREDVADQPLLVQVYHGCEYRYTDVELDKARALYPLLDLQWTYGWSLRDGLRHIQQSFPQERDILDLYCVDQRLRSLLPL